MDMRTRTDQGQNKVINIPSFVIKDLANLNFIRREDKNQSGL